VLLFLLLMVMSERCAICGVDEAASETCENFSVMSDAETFYLRSQTVKGCTVSDELAPGTRYAGSCMSPMYSKCSV